MFRKSSLSAMVVAVPAATLGLLPAMADPVAAAPSAPNHTGLVPDAPRTNMPRITTW